MARTSARRAATRCLCAAALAAVPLAASARPFTLGLSLEPGVAVSGAQPPQGLGFPGAASVKAFLAVSPYLEVSVGLGCVGLANLSLSNSSMSGMASTLGVGLRLVRPRDRGSFLGASPWADAEALSVQASAGSRHAFALGAGLAFPVDRARRVWLGPFGRYLQVLEPNVIGPTRRASDGLFAGFTFEVLVSSATWGSRADTW